MKTNPLSTFVAAACCALLAFSCASKQETVTNKLTTPGNLTCHCGNTSPTVSLTCLKTQTILANSVSTSMAHTMT